MRFGFRTQGLGKSGTLWSRQITHDVCKGCVLGAIHRFAYPELPNETQLLWYKNLQTADANQS
jgi:hypothetical protein